MKKNLLLFLSTNIIISCIESNKNQACSNLINNTLLNSNSFLSKNVNILSMKEALTNCIENIKDNQTILLQDFNKVQQSKLTDDIHEFGALLYNETIYKQYELYLNKRKKWEVIKEHLIVMAFFSLAIVVVILFGIISKKMSNGIPDKKYK